jgi:hypothetical protein
LVAFAPLDTVESVKHFFVLESTSDIDTKSGEELGSPPPGLDRRRRQMRRLGRERNLVVVKEKGAGLQTVREKYGDL